MDALSFALDGTTQFDSHFAGGDLFSSFTDGGAGLIEFPALIFPGASFSIALATHKAAGTALGIGATARLLSDRVPEWPFALFILTSGVPGMVISVGLS